MIPALDWNWQIYLLGWFSCIMSVMPVMMLWIIGTEEFGKNESIEDLKRRNQRLTKDNEELRIDNTLHRQVIDSLLSERVQQVIKDVS